MRSAKTVHPTLRQLIQIAIAEFETVVAREVPLHVDRDPDGWTVRRGAQTLHEKEEKIP